MAGGNDRPRDWHACVSPGLSPAFACKRAGMLVPDVFLLPGQRPVSMQQAMPVSVRLYNVRSITKHCSEFAATCLEGNQRNTHLSKLDGNEPALLELFWLLLTDPGIFPAPNCQKQQSLHFLANHFKHFLLGV